MCCYDEKKRIQAFVEKLGVKDDITPEEFAKALESAIADRAKIFYFIYKTLQKLYPEVDADKVMAIASYEFGKHNSKKMGNVKDAADALLNQTSRGGMLAFKQEITELSEKIAEKRIYNCPHINAFKELGCSQEEITKLCRLLLMPGDFAMLEPFPNIKLEFPKTLAEDDVCIMRITKQE
ncbi:MAG TPA: L-2-amino-thiazoline-4-carboxylic acid hydrolase [Thermoanaerobacterales bacterium]|nr:L-2-amino-thiazoline-4-carboxylic acid hydrolase [Thermoanaerobacterales bacterium]